MIRDILTSNEGVKPNSKEMEILHTHFSQCFNADGHFDIDKFQDAIKDSISIAHEGHGLNFLGKSYAKLLASIGTTTVIVPDEEHNNKPENKDSKNIYISGDNLDGLKHLRKSYSGKIKCIYIDPPYNTGTDGFVYKDNFNFTSEDLQTKLSISEDQANKILDLTKRGSASHSAWLMFMASRLQLTKDLLTDDGVIFISIDNNEYANLKLLCDTIYGEENFIEMFSWVKTSTPPSLSTKSRKTNEYILCYEKLRNDYKYLGDILDGGDQPLLNTGNAIRTLKFPRELVYFSNPRMRGIIEPYTSEKGVTLHKRININEDGYSDTDIILSGEFKWTEEFLHNEVENGTTFIIKSDKLSIRFIRDKEGYKRPTNFIRETIISPTINKVDNDVDTNESASKVLEALMGDKVFSFPKPVSLIKYLINFIIQPNDIVLDFFSGSATTGHAIMERNATEEDSLQYILVQLPEDLDENYASASSDDKKKIKKVLDFLDGIGKPHRLDEVGIERLKRAAVKIKDETGADIDYGFKHYTLVEPLESTLSKLQAFNANVMFDDNTILNEFGVATVLETWQVRDGYGFGAKSETITLDRYNAHYIGKHLYLVDSGFTENDMVALIDKYNSEGEFNPELIVLFGYSFTFSQIEMLKSNLATIKEGAKNLKVNIDIRH